MSADQISKGKAPSCPPYAHTLQQSTIKESPIGTTQIASNIEQSSNNQVSDEVFALGFDNCLELTEPVECDIHGKLPTWLSGELIRLAPSIYHVDRDNGSQHHIKHWFDGLSFAHQFRIENGKVTYQNRFTSKPVEQWIAKHGSQYYAFGEDPCKNIFQKFLTLFSSLTTSSHPPVSISESSNIGVTIAPIMDNRYFIQTDGTAIQEISPETLETKQYMEFSMIHPELTGVLASAHNQYDESKKEYFNIVLQFQEQSQYMNSQQNLNHFYSQKEEDASNMTKKRDIYKVFRIRNSSDISILAVIEENPAYIHSFALTENYVILIVWPAHLNKLSMLWNLNLESALSFSSDKKTHFYAISREFGGVVAVYESEPFFAFHTVNAFECSNGRDIVIDIATYQDLSIVKDLYLKNLRNPQMPLAKAAAKRFTLKNILHQNPRMKSDDVIIDVIDDKRSIDLPQFNNKFHMKPYRYFYGIGGAEQDKFWTQLIKVNATAKELVHWGEDGCVPGEPLFIPTPHNNNNNNDEDDGVLLSVVLDGKQKRSMLLVLDARSMKEVARVIAPQIIPYGFHGGFLPSNASIHNNTQTIMEESG